MHPPDIAPIAPVCVRIVGDLTMIRKTLFVAIGTCLLLNVAAAAAPPQLANLAPLGIERGVMSELTISGSNLTGNPRLIAPFRFQIEPASAQAKSDASNWKLKLTVATDTAVGVYPIRVQTDDGISNPFLLAVGQLPQVAEKEDNSTFETAQPIPDPPLVVEGQVAGNDVDYFRFHGRKGQFILIDAQCARIGSGIDPTIRLTTASANRVYVASADDSPGLITDARLTAILPADGDYVVELSDSRYSGANRPVYRLVIGEVPTAAEVYPLGGRAGETVGLEFRGGTLGGVKIAAATLQPPFGTDLVAPRISSAMLGISASGKSAAVLDLESLGPLVASVYPEVREPADRSAPPPKSVAPVVLNGRIDPPGDEDQFVLATTPGQRLRIRVQAYALGSALDGVLRVLGNGGAAIANSDDTNIPLPVRPGQQAQALVLPDPSLEFTIPAGTNEVILAMRDLANRGGMGFPYRIVVEPLFPDFQLLANESQVSVPRGGSAAVGITVQRNGYTGAITVTVADPPAGLMVRSGTIPAGQTAGLLSLSADPNASFAAAPIKLVARGQGVNGTFERIASKPVVYATQPPLPTCSITEYGLVAAPALALPIVLETPPAPIEVAHGFSAIIPVKLTRTKGAEGALALSPLPLPPGLAVGGSTIADKSVDGKVTITAALAAPLGTMTVGLQAKGKVAGAERTFALPAVTLSVVQPATLELAAAGVEVKPGATVELKGKIVRKGAFSGPVNVKVTGLPAGLKADPVTVAGKDSSFVVKVVADAKTKPASAASQVALAYQVEKKDYSVPNVPLAIKVLSVK
jgi:hypothetical protein